MNFRAIIRVGATAAIALAGAGISSAATPTTIVSPIGNIDCATAPEGYVGPHGYVRCEIQDYNDTPPTEPTDCDSPEGTRLTMASGALFGCGGETG